MSNLSVSCGHIVDRIFQYLTDEGAIAYKIFKKKFGRAYTINMEKYGAKFKDEYVISENFEVGKEYYTICPACLSIWEHNS